MKTKPCLTLNDVKKIAAACEAEATKNKWNVVIVILDEGGHLLWLQRMDGATPFNAQVAVEKGRSAAVSRRSGSRKKFVRGSCGSSRWRTRAAA